MLAVLPPESALQCILRCNMVGVLAREAVFLAMLLPESALQCSLRCNMARPDCSGLLEQQGQDDS